MEHIWAPWRIRYIQQGKVEGCILCDKPKENKDVATISCTGARRTSLS